MSYKCNGIELIPQVDDVGEGIPYGYTEFQQGNFEAIMSKLTNSIDVLGNLIDQRDVEWLVLSMWKVVALSLAAKHEPEARELVRQVVDGIVTHSQSNAKFFDALSEFKAEADGLNLR